MYNDNLHYNENNIMKVAQKSVGFGPRTIAFQNLSPQGLDRWIVAL